jgi:hypothetical protein
LLRPWLVVFALLVLILSQVFYALIPYRRRNYAAVLLLTIVGMGLGQLWQYLGLPGIGIGEANLLPGALLAFLLQPLAPRLPIHLRR